MTFLKRNKYNFFLFGFVVLIFFVNAYNLTFNIKPTIFHQWRQSDCLSIAKNFYEEGNGLMEPKIHWQGTQGGHAAGEMPLINYTVAKLWKVFGHKEGVYRMFNYTIFIISLFILFNTLSSFKTPVLLRFFFVTILLSSPLLTYYSYNFIADVPALSLAIISFSLFFKFYLSKSSYLFYMALLIASLAVVLKASAVVSLVIIILFSILDIVNLTPKFKIERLFNSKLSPSIAIVVAPILIYAWYAYAKSYNLKYSSDFFLIGVLPVWDLKEDELLNTATGLFNEQLSIFLNRPMLFLFFISIVFVFYNIKKLNAFLKISFVISFGFFVSFIVFFFKVFDVHDYYLSNLMLFPVIIMFCILNIFEENNFSLKTNKWVITAVVTCIFFNSLHAAAFYRLRTIKDDKICHWYPFIANNDKWYNSHIVGKHNKLIKPLSEITPVLRKGGVNRNQLFVCVPDISPNSSLYLIDQKGYSVSEQDFMRDTLWMERCKFYSCDYFLINDTALKRSVSFNTIEKKLTLKYALPGVEVYQINKK